METGENIEEHLKVHKAKKKKILRKQVRAQHTLMRHEGIECISHATQVIDSSGFGGRRKYCLPVFCPHVRAG